MESSASSESSPELIRFIGVIEKTRKYYLCSLPSNALARLGNVRGKFYCRIKDKVFSVILFQGGRGQFSDLPGKTFFLLRPRTLHELKLGLGKIKVELWSN